MEDRTLMTEKDMIAAMKAGYGLNRVIEYRYDPSLAARCMNGTFVGKADGEVEVFRGIPFAKPPVGELRWKRPEPVDKDDRVFEAYFNGKTPIQTEWSTEQASYYPQGEDCLCLNIWRSSHNKDEKKTVMVFFHGGSYGWGGTADPMYDGSAFVSSHPDIIMVTVGYRTGLMGFVDFDGIKGCEAFPDAPNLGILDQIEALRWIKANIRAFGGDPDSVTVFGESAGGGSVSLLPVIPQARGLFKRIIAESGSVALTFSKDECREFTRRLLRETGAKSMDDLMGMSEAQLMAVNEKLNQYNNFPQRDGRLIPLDPYAPYLEGRTAGIDMLMGTNADESNYWIREIGGIVAYRMSAPVKFENDMKRLPKSDRWRVRKFMDSLSGHSIWRMNEFYNEIMFRLPMIRQAEGHCMNGGRMFMYYWTEPSAIRYHGACHAVELAYVFGNTENTIYTGAPADKALSDLVMDMWANFARTGDPSVGETEWTPYDTARRPTMVISKEALRMENDVLSAQRKLLYPILKYRINPSYASLDYNVPFVHKTAAIGAAALAVTAAAIGFIINRFTDN